MHKHKADILIVEDSEQQAFLVREAMSGEMPDDMHWVPDGAKALDFLNNRAPYEEAPVPSLVLLDLKVPWCDGFEVLRLIKGDERLRSIPVIVLTGSSERDEIEKCYDLGANCFISKPDNAEKMKALVNVINHFWLDVVKLPHEAE